MRIRVEGTFRLPWPGEIGGQEVAEIYCARCAKDRLARVQAGEFAAMAMPQLRRAANS